MQKPSVAFLGLGVMGYPMAEHLSDEGYPTRVYNRTGSRAAAWSAEFDGENFDSPQETVKEAEFVFICVGNDDDLRAIMTREDGILAGAKEGTIIVDHTTTSADVAKKMYQLAKQQGCDFIDAPVSGGQQGAENGQLTIMCGGDSEVFKKAKPIMETYAKACTLMGDIGMGQTTKMVNQICIAGIVQGLSEGMLLAEKSGLDLKQVMDVISLGAAGSWQMVNRHETMIADEYNHGFAVDWMRKDLDICLNQAEKLGLDLPLTKLVDGYYEEVQKMGGSRWDTSSLYKRIREKHKKAQH